MSRIEINGQVNVGNPFDFGNLLKQRTEIDPHASSTLPVAFTNQVNEALKKLEPVKKKFVYLGVMNIVFIASIMFVNLFLRDAFVGKDGMSSFFLGYMIVVFGFIAVIFFFFLKTRNIVRSTFEEVKRICESHSSDSGGVIYKLEDEWWGGCSKPNVLRRYIIIVENSDMEQGANLNTGENQIESSPQPESFEQHPQMNKPSDYSNTNNISTPATGGYSNSTSASSAYNNNNTSTTFGGYSQEGNTSNDTQGGNSDNPSSLFNQLASGI
mmetsp:Transcript_110/g.103  ORF Transcript_110/g.103 Transcript_110/m.103 type:complete len:269 (+) Transcript_110:310-1116(+)